MGGQEDEEGSEWLQSTRSGRKRALGGCGGGRLYFGGSTVVDWGQRLGIVWNLEGEEENFSWDLTRARRFLTRWDQHAVALDGGGG